MNKSHPTSPRLNTLTQFIRFSIVGFVASVLCFSLYLLFTHFGAAPKLVMSLLYFFNMAICFVCNWRWVFANNQHFLNASGKYFFTQLIGYVLNLMALEIIADLLGYPHQLAQALGMIIVAAFLFIAFKFYVFPSNQASINTTT